MIKWEYKRIRIDKYDVVYDPNSPLLTNARFEPDFKYEPTPVDIEEFINDLGEEGWELVTVNINPDYNSQEKEFYFKRLKEE